MAQASARNPDIILLDLGFPDMNGTAVIEHIRAWSNMPIIVLSARDQEQVKVQAFDLGADDYVTKPFGVDELLARMRVALRHANRPIGDAVEPVYTFGDVTVDLGRRQVLVSGTEIHFTPIEYKLLTTLVRYAGKVVTHRQLLKEVWGPLHIEEGHYLRVYMRQLRNKVEADPAQPRHLVTELGGGYRLRSE
ncbi:MAG: winged helix-turn-helix domain-containing protein [Nitrospira sp.]|nr:winged helix-turn-helix domain-containing protein [Nitrospira sp.]HRA97184.1 winged helix-turn-helix domain-containing protein [Nitrospira sp.]